MYYSYISFPSHCPVLSPYQQDCCHGNPNPSFECQSRERDEAPARSWCLSRLPETTSTCHSVAASLGSNPKNVHCFLVGCISRYAALLTCRLFIDSRRLRDVHVVLFRCVAMCDVYSQHNQSNVHRVITVCRLYDGDWIHMNTPPGYCRSNVNNMSCKWHVWDC